MSVQRTYDTYPTVFVLCSLITGTLAYYAINFSLPTGAYAILFLLLVLFVIYLVKSSRRIVFFMMATLFISLGYMNMAYDQKRIDKTKQSLLFIPSNYEISMRIASKKQRYDGSVEYTGKDLVIDGRREIGKLLVRLPEDTIAVGSMMTAFCNKIYKIKSLENKFEFNYESYLARSNVWGRIYPKAVEYRNKKDLSPNFIAWQQEVKRILTQNIQNKQAAAVVAAMTIGEKGDLDRETRQVMSKLGMAHVMAVSGLHLGIIFMILSLLVKLAQHTFGIRNRQFILATIPFMAIYVGLSGYSPSATRAFGMISLYLISRHLFRLRMLSYEIVAIVAILLLIFDPNQLFSISFLLSFTAIIGILIHLKDFHHWQHKNPVLRYIAGGSIIGLICTVYCTPFLLFFFQQSSWLGPITSVFATLVATMIIALSLLSLLGGVFSIGGPFSYLNGKVAEFFLQFNDGLNKVPGAIENVWMGDISLVILALVGFLFLKALSGKIKFVVPTILFFLLANQVNNLEKTLLSASPHVEIYNTFTDWQLGVFSQGQTLIYSSTGKAIALKKAMKSSQIKDLMTRLIPQQMEINGISFGIYDSNQEIENSLDYLLIEEINEKTNLEDLIKNAKTIICKRTKGKNLNTMENIYVMEEEGPLTIGLISDRQK